MHPRENAALGSVTQVSFFGGDGLCNSPVFFPKGGFCALTRFLPHWMREWTVSCKREGVISGTGAGQWALEAPCAAQPIHTWHYPTAHQLQLQCYPLVPSLRDNPHITGHYWRDEVIAHDVSSVGVALEHLQRKVHPVLNLIFLRVLLISSFKHFHSKTNTLITWDSATRF